MQSTSTMNHQDPGARSANASMVDAQHSLTLPPSPTLTNPDMILPYETERETSTPSPPFEPSQLPSPPDFRHLQERDHEQSLHPQSTERDREQPEDDSEIGMAVSFPNRQDNKRPSPPRNLWALGGHQVGPPLSDIGEEDSVASPPRSTYSWHENNSSAGNESPVLASSPNIESHWSRGDGAGREEECDGWSDDSSSTVSAHSNNGRWDGFDGSNVEQNGDLHSRVDRTDLQGQITPTDSARDNDDYRHYHRDEEEQGNGHHESPGFARGEEENSMGSIPEEKGEEESMDEISSAMLSNEAERILENAKKRLTFMEGNLSRARTSIRMSPSPSPSPVNTGGFPLGGAQKPVGGLYRSISQSDRRVQTGQAGSRLRLGRTLALSRDANNNQVHARGSSETHLPSTLQSTLPTPENRHVFRSMSAMGSTGSTLHFGDNDNPHYRDSARSSSAHSRTLGSLSHQHQPLDALQEDDVQEQFEPQPQQQTYQPSRESTPEAQHISGNSGQNEVPRISTTEEFNSAYPSSSPPSRTHSQLHVRDLQDQMLGLKTKLSTLKVRTEEDSLRRRSLQSLRTPSPFTAAEEWYTGAVEYRDGGNSLNANAGYGFSPQYAEGGFEDKLGQVAEGSDSARGMLDNKHTPGHSPENDDQHSIMESHYEDAEENYSDDELDSPLKESDRAALDEILNESEDESIFDEFHEASADASEPTRHEDREDAFDYEHFFLHSALGNYYSRSKERRESYGSNASAETTRPTERPQSYSSATSKQSANNRLSKGHVRNPSADSVSTIATFATATEGEGSDDEDSEGEIDNALNWNSNGNGHAYSTNQTWPMQNDYVSSSRSQQAPNGSRDYPDSESSTSSTAETERGISTPRGQRSQSVEDDVGLRPNRVTQILSPETGKENSRPTSSLFSSLVSVASSPARPGSSSSQLNNDDTIALEQLFKSLGKVCLSLQESTEPNGDFKADMRSVAILRRRLDAARRVLDGELDP